MATYRYWRHFLALEADFAATARFVELNTSNFDTYSTEYTKLLLAASSEIDVILKVISDILEPSAKAKKIDQYRNALNQHIQIAKEEVLIRQYDLSFKPWDSWAQNKTPDWWHDYNGVKHRRHQEYMKANLKNCANAICGLFIAVIYCCHAEGQSPRLLRPEPILLGREDEPGLLALESDYTVPAFT